jgi:hypothetical protein
MATINQLSRDISPALGDSLPIFSNSNGNTQRITVNDLAAYILSLASSVYVGATGPQGIQGVQGPIGVGISSIVRTSGTGAAGTTDTYTITYTNATTSTFSVVNGANGSGGGGGAPVQQTLTQAGATTAVDWANGDTLIISSVTSDFVIATPLNPIAGHKYIIIGVQDSTGYHNIEFNNVIYAGQTPGVRQKIELYFDGVTYL